MAMILLSLSGLQGFHGNYAKGRRAQKLGINTYTHSTCCHGDHVNEFAFLPRVTRFTW